MSFPSREQVLELIEEHAPPRLRQVLEENLLPAIALSARDAEDASIAVGASKIGGAPDVPRGFEWPQWKGKPLGFLAQFDLEEAAAFDVERALPPSGTLSFFYAIEEQPWGSEQDSGAWRVEWWPREAELERRALPFEATPSNSLPPLALDFALEWRLRSFAPAFFESTSGEERAAISALLKRLAAERGSEGLHRLLGEADSIQNPVELDLHEKFEGEEWDEDEEDAAEYYERLLADGLRWRLLLQIDSDWAQQPRWMWGDLGRIYFGIRREDLESRRFEAAWLQLQCS